MPVEIVNIRIVGSFHAQVPDELACRTSGFTARGCAWFLPPGAPGGFAFVGAGGSTLEEGGEKAPGDGAVEGTDGEVVKRAKRDSSLAKGARR
jgi:hypothetical protein